MSLISHGSLNRLKWALHAAGMLACIAVFAIGECVLFHPLDRMRLQNSEQAQELEQRLKRSQPLRAEHLQLTRMVEEAKKHRAELLARIPDTARETELLQQLSVLANGVEFQIQNYSPGKQRACDDVSEREILLSCQGSYPSICRFLNGLASLPRLTDIARLEIKSQKSDGGNYLVEMILVIYYSAKQPKQPGLASVTSG